MLKPEFSLPDNPYCLWMEAAYFALLLCRDVKPISIDVYGRKTSIVPKLGIGKPTSLIIDGEFAGYVVSTDTEYSELCTIGRPLLLTPSKTATKKVASGCMEMDFTFSFYNRINVALAYLDYQGKLFDLFDRRKISFDRTTFSANMNNYTNWVRIKQSTY